MPTQTHILQFIPSSIPGYLLFHIMATVNAITYQQAIKASLSKVTYTLIVIVVLYRYEFIFTRLAVVLKTIKSIGKYIEKMKLSCMLGWNVNVSTIEIKVVVS